MRPKDPRTGIESLDRQECLSLLAEDVVGRLAVIDGGRPAIFPVNYVLDGEAIVVRTDPGTKLDAAGRAAACFEIDSFDRLTRTGWSVVASGRLDEVTRYNASTLARISELGVQPWAGGAKDRWLRLVAERITGRRVVPTC